MAFEEDEVTLSMVMIREGEADTENWGKQAQTCIGNCRDALSAQMLLIPSAIMASRPAPGHR